MRPWNSLPICDCGESLEVIPPQIFCLKPHPYLSVGAPYLNASDPWKLRQGVIRLLLNAQKKLQLLHPSLRLAIFDGWRPIPVQAYMVEYSIHQECLLRGIDRSKSFYSSSFQEVVDEVSKFWAPATFDPKAPPPHSTGGAVDITLIGSDNHQVDMGGNIDDISPISNPNYYKKKGLSDLDSKEYLWHSRRSLLTEIMQDSGFIPHPYEWWHFSYGDQLWAWKSNLKQAIYGTTN